MNKYGWLDEYLLSKTGAVKDFKLEWNWYRYLVGGKMFGAAFTMTEAHGDYRPGEIISLKCEPAFSDIVRAQYDCIRPGYYMNKVHWNSIYLDGDVPDELVKTMCDMSFDLVFKTLTKKLQSELQNA